MADNDGKVVLYVEDEDVDRFLMERAFIKSGCGADLRLVNDGRSAIEYLSGSGNYADREKYPLPAVLLLDLNLPEIHGFEVLKWVRAHPAYKTLPVVIFSSSEMPDDKVRARQLAADEFWSKPGSGWSFQDVQQKLAERWLAPRPPVDSSPA